jgi:hypothetical protein
VIGGVSYPLLAWPLDVLPCLVCWRLIVGVPLLLMSTRGMLAVCERCVAASGFMEALRIGEWT